jgi:hypothetical protein
VGSANAPSLYIPTPKRVVVAKLLGRLCRFGDRAPWRSFVDGRTGLEGPIEFPAPTPGGDTYEVATNGDVIKENCSPGPYILPTNDHTPIPAPSSSPSVSTDYAGLVASAASCAGGISLAILLAPLAVASLGAALPAAVFVAAFGCAGGLFLKDAVSPNFPNG